MASVADDPRALDAFLRAHAAVPSGARFAAGTCFGPWRLTAFLGRGGSSEVYRAVHSSLPLAAAVKVLVRDEAAARARFDREGWFARTNRDPAFPRFFDRGEHVGRPYLVTELLEPAELPRTDRAVADYILAVAERVGRLHARGLVHRDLKPQNVMRRANGERVLIDFGLLKQVSVRRAPRLPLSRSVVGGRAVGAGTPRFSAPEQFSGGDVTPAADIHALGVIVNECFQDRPPRCWAKIVRRATSSIPAQRYGDVAAFTRAVRRRHRARRLLVAAVCAGLVALGAAAALWRIDARRAQAAEARRQAQERIDREHEEIQEMLLRDVY